MALAFQPRLFLHGCALAAHYLQPDSIGIVGTLFELLSLWFLAGFLENDAQLQLGDRALCVFGSWHCGGRYGHLHMWQHLWLRRRASSAEWVRRRNLRPAGGDRRAVRRCTVHAFSLPIGIKARYMVAIYALITIAMLFGSRACMHLLSLAARWVGFVYSPGSAARIQLRFQRALVWTAQSLLPLEAPARRPQVRGLYELAGPHRPV